MPQNGGKIACTYQCYLHNRHKINKFEEKNNTFFSFLQNIRYICK
jgi:hypothetical protein